MKKILFALSFLTAVAMASAQETKYNVVTNSFFNNTFINVSTGYTQGNVNFGLAIGKWFTPGIGLRVKGVYGNGQPKANFCGDVCGDANCHDYAYNNKYLLANVQTMLNLTNIFMGYNDSRHYCFIPYVGAGLARSCSYNENGLNFTFGLLNSIRLSKRCSLNVEIGKHCYSHEFSGHPETEGYDYFKPKSHNSWFAELGLSIKLGNTKGWRKAPDAEAIRNAMQAEMDALNAQLEDERTENQRLQEELHNQHLQEE